MSPTCIFHKGSKEKAVLKASLPRYETLLHWRNSTCLCIPASQSLCPECCIQFTFCSKIVLQLDRIPLSPFFVYEHCRSFFPGQRNLSPPGTDLKGLCKEAPIWSLQGGSHLGAPLSTLCKVAVERSWRAFEQTGP